MCVGSPLAVEPADRDRPRLVADAADPDLERPGWQEGQELVRPLDGRHAVALQELRDPEVHKLGEALSAVGGHLVDGQAAPVRVDQDEGRARRARRGAETTHEPLDEAGLPCAELADQGDDVAGPEHRRQPLARGLGLLGARGVERSEEHTSELQSPYDLVCRLLLEKKKKKKTPQQTYKQKISQTPHRASSCACRLNV